MSKGFEKKYKGAFVTAGYGLHSEEHDRPFEYDKLKKMVYHLYMDDIKSIQDDILDSSSHLQEAEELRSLRNAIFKRHGSHDGESDDEDPESGRDSAGATNSTTMRKRKSQQHNKLTSYIRHEVKNVDEEITDPALKFMIFSYMFKKEVHRMNNIYMRGIDKVRLDVAVLAGQANQIGVKVLSKKDVEELPTTTIMRAVKTDVDSDHIAASSKSVMTSGSSDSHDSQQEEESNSEMDLEGGLKPLPDATSVIVCGDSPPRPPRGATSSPQLTSTLLDSDKSSPGDGDGGGEPVLPGESSSKHGGALYNALAMDSDTYNNNDPDIDISSSRRSPLSKKRQQKKKKSLKVRDTLFSVATAPRTIYRTLNPIDEKHEKKVVADASMKNALQVEYHRVHELKAYRVLNFTAFIKILKKWDKVNSKKVAALEGGKQQPLKEKPQKAYPSLMPDCEICIQRYESSVSHEISDIYATLFCGGDVLEAYGKLTLAKGEEPKGAHDMTIGTLLGMLSTILAFLIFNLSTIKKSVLGALWIDPSMYIYMTASGLLLYRWMWYLQISVWMSAKINFRSLLKMPSKLLPDAMKAVKLHLMKTVVFVLFVYISMESYASYEDGTYSEVISHRVWSVLLFCGTILYFFYTYAFETNAEGIFGLDVLVNCISLVYPNTPIDRFAMDVATSLTQVFNSSVYSTCFIFNGLFLRDDVNMENLGTCDPLVNTNVYVWSFLFTVAPFVIRLGQCMRRHYDSASKDVFMWPHGVNSCKYGLSIITICMGFFFKITLHSSTANVIIYLIICSCGTALASYFDVVADWGLGQNMPDFSSDVPLLEQKDIFLRPDLMYENRSIYYFALCINPCLRCMWTVAMLNTSKAFDEEGINSTDFAFAVCILEIFRRFVWGLVKMEFDHITAGANYQRRLMHESNKSQKAGQRVVSIHFETNYYDDTGTNRNIFVPLTLLGVILATIAMVITLIHLTK
jgi:hypothetical protein